MGFHGIFLFVFREHHRDCFTNAYSHPNSNADSYTNSGSNANANSNTDANSDSYACSNPHAQRYRGGESRNPAAAGKPQL
jgi:hypothetical protein